MKTRGAPSSSPSLEPGPDPLGRAAVSDPRSRVAWAYLIVFLLGAVAVGAWTWHHVQRDRRAILEHWSARIATVVEDRGRLVAEWLGARRADAEVLAAHPAVRAILAGAARGEGLLVPHLNRVTATYGYAGIWLFDQRGRVAARSSGASEPGRATAAAVLASRRPLIDLVEGAGGQRLLTVSVPVATAGPAAAARPLLGVITLVMRPEAALFPLLGDASATSQSGEALLFRVDGGEPAYLSPLGHASAGWAALTRSIEALRRELPGGSDGVAVGQLDDYRAVPVLAAIRRIPGTAWALALKVDRDEALADFLRAGRFAGVAGGFLLLSLGAALITAWRERERGRLVRARMAQERALFDLTRYAQKVADSVPSGLMVLSADLRVVSVNPALLETFGLAHEDAVGAHVHDVIWEETLAARALEVLRTGVGKRDVLMELCVGGAPETRPALVTMTNIRMAGDEAPRLLLILQDLTEAERIEAARRASDQRFHDLVQGIDAIVWEADAATLRYSFVSQRAAEVLGHPVARWLEDPDWAFARVHPADRERVARACSEAIARGADHEHEYRALAADGREVWLRDIVHVVTDAQGRPAHLRGVTVDVTERKRQDEALRQAEDQLRQAQKMDAIGQLAGGIAHDFNNLLMVIRGDSDLILRRLEPDDPLRGSAEGVRDAADQAAALTRQLLAFSRKQVLAPTVLDLNAVLAGIQRMLERLLGVTIVLVTFPGRDVGRIRADAAQVEQMILNLAVNARDAMPEGGTLTIRTANATLDGHRARRRGGVRPGEYVALEVTDTGVGMDAETRARLFEPFFTTKGPGKGTGLGLSTVYGIVSQSGGHIHVESEPGRGASFLVLFPRVAADAEAAAAAPAPPASAGEPTAARGETLLLVEDARRVRAVLREILEMHGYRVLEARNGPEALRVSAAHPGAIDLLVTDVVMPHMSGAELAQRLTALRPSLRVLYVSGYADDATVRHGAAGAGRAFLAKPFTPDALAGLVRRLLDAPPAPAGRAPLGGS
jgi:PAS domain S-box-containing protein